MRYLELLRFAAHSTGVLVNVLAPDRELPRHCYIFQFEKDVLAVRANEDDDTIIIEAGVKLEHLTATDDLANQQPWSSLLGKRLFSAWLLTNHAGFTDGLQLRFGDDIDKPVDVQLLAVSSEFVTSRVHPFP